MRNHSIDSLKFFCAFLVVLIHVQTPFTSYYLPITRCAVPLFFMVSGYYLYCHIDATSIKRNISRITRMLIYGTIFYVPLYLLSHPLCDVLDIFSWKSLFRIFVLNENPIAFHLWYLQAYICALGVILFLAKYQLIEKSCYVVPLLLLTDVVFGKYGKLLMGGVDVIYLRNFIFVGVPYILIGFLMRKHQDKITRRSVWRYVVLSVVALIIAYITNYYLQSNEMLGPRDHSLMTTILSVCVFALVLKNTNNKETIWSELGRKYSLPIYINHIFVGAIIVTATKQVGLMEVYSYVSPFLVVLSSIVFTYVIRRFGIHI